MWTAHAKQMWSLPFSEMSWKQGKETKMRKTLNNDSEDQKPWYVFQPNSDAQIGFNTTCLLK